MQSDIDEVLHFIIHRLYKNDVSNGFEMTGIAVDMLTVRTAVQCPLPRFANPWRNPGPHSIGCCGRRSFMASCTQADLQLLKESEWLQS